MDSCLQPVGLIDLDGTLANYDASLEKDMLALQSAEETVSYKDFPRDSEPSYIRARMDLIKNNSSWWENLEPLYCGMEIYEMLLKLGFRVVVLTQGPRINAEAWKGKLLWCRKHLRPNTDVIITRDKSLVYGKVLVDDWPPYLEAWLAHRPRGIGIMPDQPWNRDFSHPRVLRCENDPMAYSETYYKLEGIALDFKKSTEDQS